MHSQNNLKKMADLNTTKGKYIYWNDPLWSGESQTGNPQPSEYSTEGLKIIKAQSTTAGTWKFQKGIFIKNDLGHPQIAIFIVSVGTNNNPMIGDNDLVLKPCPPLCGDDGDEESAR
ncbi:MAG: hypothetical protein WBB31_13285 [Saprospiraceae bacterium]